MLGRVSSGAPRDERADGWACPGPAESSPSRAPFRDRRAPDPEARARQLANLRVPWQPGQSGNPAGSARGRTLAQAINALLRTTISKVRQEDLVKVATELGLDVAPGLEPATLQDLRRCFRRCSAPHGPSDPDVRD